MMDKEKINKVDGEEEAKCYEFKADTEKTPPQADTDEKFTLLQSQFLRLQADFDNFKKRNNATSIKRYNDGVEEVIKAILPTIDYLDMAIVAQSDEAQRKGIELVKKTFMDALEKYDIKEIEVFGKEFDPQNAEAVMSKDDPDNAGKVVEVMKKGYCRGEQILRHAMVVVGQ
ncbi:MAG: nucleotide exchange factor GrpE [Clostridia bacterium]